MFCKYLGSYGLLIPSFGPWGNTGRVKDIKNNNLNVCMVEVLGGKEVNKIISRKPKSHIVSPATVAGSDP